MYDLYLMMYNIDWMAHNWSWLLGNADKIVNEDIHILQWGSAQQKDGLHGMSVCKVLSWMFRGSSVLLVV